MKTRQSASQSIPKPVKTYFPAFLDLSRRRVVVVGGGKVAERKISSLLKTGAFLTVISPEITKKIRKEKDAGRLT
ncbi:MAG: NAD(P)-dependent oxidoreductase, partial [Nitrospirota bacterium]